MEQLLVKGQILGLQLIENSMSNQDANLIVLLDKHTMVSFAIPPLQLEEFHLLEGQLLILIQWECTS